VTPNTLRTYLNTVFFTFESHLRDATKTTLLSLLAPNPRVSLFSWRRLKICCKPVSAVTQLS